MVKPLRDFIDSIMEIFQHVNDRPSCPGPVLIRLSIEFNGETVQSGVFGVVAGRTDRTLRLVETVTHPSQLPVELHYVNMKTGELLMATRVEEACLGASVEVFIRGGVEFDFPTRAMYK